MKNEKLYFFILKFVGKNLTLVPNAKHSPLKDS